MKIIEAIKQLRLLEKKIARNHEYIEKYSSMISTQVPSFNTVEEQREKVKSLIQETLDFVQRRLDLKEQINYTNIMTNIVIDKKTWSLQNLLDLQRGNLDSIRETYNSLSDRTAQGTFRNATTVDGKIPQVVRLYEENFKLTELDKCDNLKTEIESRLEVINAVTDLLAVPRTVPEAVSESIRIYRETRDSAIIEPPSFL